MILSRYAFSKQAGGDGTKLNFVPPLKTTWHWRFGPSVADAAGIVGFASSAVTSAVRIERLPRWQSPSCLFFDRPMSCAYVIEADYYPDDEGDLATLVDGKLLTRRLDFINLVAAQLGLPSLDSFYSCSDSFLRGLGFDPIEVADSERWFDVADGMRWFGAVRHHVLCHQARIAGAAELIEELTDFLQALREIGARGGCWRLTLDF